jgi:hypothetical protein
MGRAFLLKIPPANPNLPLPTVEFVAGFFDGEGSVSINKPSYTLHARVANTYRLGLEVIAQSFRGMCSLDEDVTQTPRRRVKYFLEFSGPNARKFLEIILPYLLFKRAVAGIGIGYQKWKEKHPLKGSPEERRKIIETRQLAYKLLRTIHEQGRLKA